MRHVYAAVLAVLAVPAVPATPAAAGSPIENASAIRERLLRDDTAYELVRSLTSEAGPRLAGSPGDAKGVAWAVERMTALGFRNVVKEPVKVPHWDRGTLTLEQLGTPARTLTALSLGGSVGTDGQPIEGEVLRLSSVADLRSVSRAQVAGRIVLFTARMREQADGSPYVATVPIRSRGAAEAAKLGAAAVVVRSVGTDGGTAHTGAMNYREGVPRIPAVAISNDDADRLETALDAGEKIRLRLTSTARRVGEATSYNVIGEIPGRTRDIVLLAAHLDSWDVGTGAQDDAAGVALVLGAGRALVGLPPPRRTVRVVLFANEEFGLSGAHAYAVAHAAELERHAVALEADFGGGRVYGLGSRVPPERLASVRELAGALEPLAVRYYDNRASGGADIWGLRGLGVPILSLLQDGTTYFRHHHSSSDTLETIDRDALRQAAAAYAVTAYAAAESAGGFGQLPVEIDAEE